MLPTISTGNVASALAGGYEVANSLRFNDGSSDSLSLSVSGTSQSTTGTISFWFKRSTISADQRVFTNYIDANNYGGIKLQSDDKMEIVIIDGGSVTGKLVTNRLFRDVSAWYHCVVSIDSSNSTAGNRMRLYINGSEETSFSTDTNPSSSATMEFFTNGTNRIGQFNSSQYYDGYIAEFVMIHGTQLDATSFGEFDEDSPNIWKPIDVSTLSFNSKDYYLDFENASSLGADVSGNSNNFTVNNLTSVDQSTDTCTNNFATMNSIAVPPSNAPTFAEGNTKVSTNSSNANPVISTIGVSQGKWYAEAKRISFDSGSDDDGFRIGFGVTYDDNVNITPPAISNSGHYFMIGTGTVYNGSTDLGDKAGDSNISDNGVVGIALDLDNNRISWAFNGAWMTGSNAWSGSSPSSYVTIESGKTYFFLQTDGSTGRGYTAGWNFGGSSAFTISSGNSDANGYGNFEYPVPSGYYALNTKNLAEFG